MRGYKMKYSIYLKHHDGTGSYLAYRGRTEWGIRTAKKHLKDVVSELVKGGKYGAVKYAALVVA